VNLVNGWREVVEGILDHPGIDAVSFVGSAPVAKIVYERSAKAGKRVQALGGAKNHMVVMPDAVVDQTVSGIIGSAFGAAGQRCMAGSVVGHGRRGARPADAVAGLGDRGAVGRATGSPTAPTSGPVISCTARERIREWIDRGEGRRRRGGRRRPRGVGEEVSFVGPTILDDVAPDAPIVQEEVFGPVLTVVRADSLDDAIAIVNARASATARRSSPRRARRSAATATRSRRA
jgi:malonate-semialdehyde dehydrogenase (acetylating)/methylmalonate-semialdehyde dehydrogenase